MVPFFSENKEIFAHYKRKVHSMLIETASQEKQFKHRFRDRGEWKSPKLASNLRISQAQKK